MTNVTKINDTTREGVPLGGEDVLRGRYPEDKVDFYLTVDGFLTLVQRFYTSHGPRSFPSPQ